MLHDIGGRFERIITIEDGILRGGVGEAITAFMAYEGYRPKIKSLGIDDCFVEQGKPAELYEQCGYDERALERIIEEMFNNK